MVKKIVVAVLLVGFAGVLVWGGINRTSARSVDRKASGSEGRGQAGKTKDSDPHGQGTIDGESQSRGSTSGVGSNQGGGRGRGKDVLDDDETEALYLALSDEVHALTFYQAVIAEFGQVEPFVELVQAESRHVDALLNHFEKNGVPVPENPWGGELPAFDSIQDACKIGVEAEIENAALYEQLFSMTDDPGLIQVFTNLSRASRESHLPELQACQ